MIVQNRESGPGSPEGKDVMTMSETKKRPYFIWNTDLTEDDVRQILASGSSYFRVQMMSTIDQVLTVVRQLKPEDREIIRRAIEPPPWNQRLEELLTRVWARVESYPITEEEVDAEVELARQAIYAQNSAVLASIK